MHQNAHPRNETLLAWALTGSPAAFRVVVSGLLLLSGGILLLSVG